MKQGSLKEKKSGKMQLRKPKKEDQNKLMDYILEHYINGKMNISASNSMPTMQYEDQLKN